MLDSKRIDFKEPLGEATFEDDGMVVPDRPRWILQFLREEWPQMEWKWEGRFRYASGETPFLFSIKPLPQFDQVVMEVGIVPGPTLVDSVLIKESSELHITWGDLKSELTDFIEKGIDALDIHIHNCIDVMETFYGRQIGEDRYDK